MAGKKDFTQVAHDVFMQATGQVPKPKLTVRQKSGQRGGLKGGKIRAETVSPDRRSEIAKKAALSRWGKA